MHAEGIQTTQENLLLYNRIMSESVHKTKTWAPAKIRSSGTDILQIRPEQCLLWAPFLTSQTFVYTSPPLLAQYLYSSFLCFSSHLFLPSCVSTSSPGACSHGFWKSEVCGLRLPFCSWRKPRMPAFSSQKLWQLIVRELELALKHAFYKDLGLRKYNERKWP